MRDRDVTAVRWASDRTQINVKLRKISKCKKEDMKNCNFDGYPNKIWRSCQ